MYSIDDIFSAYCKAKVDVSYERLQAMAIAFLKYERSLESNLNALLELLNNRHSGWENDINFIGSSFSIPKSYAIAPSSVSENDHFYISDMDEQYRVLCTNEQPNNNTLDLRPFGHFTVNMHVISALWINTVGHHLDGCLDNSALGLRLKRKGNARLSPYDKDAYGSFKPYHFAYGQYRNNGIKAIRDCLKRSIPVTAITMDLASYYHSIEPEFALSKSFHNAIGLDKDTGDLMRASDGLTRKILIAFKTWSLIHIKRNSDAPSGLPVGISASQILSNVLLRELDHDMQKYLKPLYYARYVDDLFLVIDDDEVFTTPKRILDHLSAKVNCIDATPDGLAVLLPYASQSRLLFKTSKQRIFRLSGHSGSDLLDTITSKLDEVSSQRRMLPDIHEFEKSPAATVLAAAKLSSEEPDMLRKADGTSLKRMSLSILIMHMQKLAKAIPPHEWIGIRVRFYNFIMANVITPLRFIEMNEYFYRLLNLAVHCRDFEWSAKIVERIKEVYEAISAHANITTLGLETATHTSYTNYLYHKIFDTVACALGNSNLHPHHITALSSLVEKITALNPSGNSYTASDLMSMAKGLYAIDLSYIPFKQSIIDKSCKAIDVSIYTKPIHIVSASDRYRTISDMLQRIGIVKDATMAIIVGIRPLQLDELTYLFESSPINAKLLMEYSTAARRKWTPEIHDSIKKIDYTLRVFGEERRLNPSIALCCIETSSDDWRAAAILKHTMSTSRYDQISRLLKSIFKLPRAQKPDYIVFPELSLPPQWYTIFADSCKSHEINLIAGIEYQCLDLDKPDIVCNEVRMMLCIHNKYKQWITLRQFKTAPASVEKKELADVGKMLYGPQAGDVPFVVQHDEFCFSAFVCSEFTDIVRRSKSLLKNPA